MENLFSKADEKACALFSSSNKSWAAPKLLQAQIDQRPFSTCRGNKKCWLDGDKTNKPASLFLYIIFLAQNALFAWEKGRSESEGGYTGATRCKTPSPTGSPSKISFFQNAKFQGNKKATPSDTLSVPLKISRLVWLYGTPEGTRTPSLQNRNLTLYPIALRARLTRDHQRARLL